MKRTRKPERKNILRSYLITYFAVMLVPLTICCAYYLKIVSTISKDDIREKTIEMKHAENLVDTMMDEIVALGKSLTTDSSVNQFKNLFEPFDYPVTGSASRTQTNESGFVSVFHLFRKQSAGNEQ